MVARTRFKRCVEGSVGANPAGGWLTATARCDSGGTEGEAIDTFDYASN